MNACPDCQQPSHWGECSPVALATCRMRAWAAANPHADTQGITEDEWMGLAFAALNRPKCPSRSGAWVRSPFSYTRVQLGQPHSSKPSSPSSSSRPPQELLTWVDLVKHFLAYGYGKDRP